jgi:hypothetical protein
MYADALMNLYTRDVEAALRDPDGNLAEIVAKVA